MVWHGYVYVDNAPSAITKSSERRERRVYRSLVDFMYAWIILVYINADANV